MQFEAVEPAHTAFPTLRQPGKDLVRVDATIMANPDRETVNELNAGRLAFAGLQIRAERQQRERNQLDKAGITGQTGKLRSFPRQHRPKIKVLKGAVVRSMKPHQDRHDL